MILQACKVIASRFLPRAYLLNACFFVTYRCNAQCSFCNIGNRSLPAPELNTSEVKHIFNDMRAHGVRQVSLVGGEPMLRKDLPELITHLRQLDIFISVVTNGFWVREDVLASKPDMLHVSLDSIGTQHDRLRNVRNAFQKAMAAIEQYSALKSRYGYRFGISMVLMPDNVEQVQDLLQLGLKHDVDNFGIQPVILPQVREKMNNWSFTADQISRLTDDLPALKHRYPGVIGPSSMFLKAIPDYLRGPHQHRLHCFGGGTFINIDPVGDVYTCLFMEAAGNLREQPLAKILATPNYRNLRRRAMRRECPDCLCPDFFEPNLLLSPCHWRELFKKYLKNGQRFG